MKIKNKKPLGKCPKCGEIINLGLSKRWRQMRVEIDSLQEERKEAIKRAQNAIRMKHAQRYQFHKYIAQLYTLYTPEQKEKAKKISQELKERLKHIERKYLGTKEYPITFLMLSGQRGGMSQPPLPFFSDKRMGMSLALQSEMARKELLKELTSPQLIIIDEGHTAMKPIDKEGIRELLEKLMKISKGIRRTEWYYPYPNDTKISKEKPSQTFTKKYVQKLFGNIDWHIKKEETRLQKEIEQFYNRHITNCIKLERVTKLTKRITKEGLPICQRYWKHKAKCKCGANATTKGMCQKCYAKNYREKNRQKVNAKMREAYKERSINIPTFGTKKGTHHVLLRKKDAPKKEQIKKEVKKITDKVFEEVIKNPRKFLDSIIEQNENEYSLKEELEQLQQAKKSLSKIQKQRLEYIKKKIERIKKWKLKNS